MTAIRIGLSGTLGNIIGSCHNRRAEKKLLHLRLVPLNSLITTDDEDEAEHKYLP